MGREWSERHIIELIDRHGGGVVEGFVARTTRLLLPSGVPHGGVANTLRLDNRRGPVWESVLSLSGIRNTHIIQPGTSFAAAVQPGALEEIFRGGNADPRVHVFMPDDPMPSRYGGRHVMFHRMIPGIGSHGFNRGQTVDFGDGETYSLSGIMVNYGGPEFTQTISHAVANSSSDANFYNVLVGASAPNPGDESFWPMANKLNDEHVWGSYLTLGEPMETFTMFALMAQFIYEKQQSNDTTISTIDTRDYGFTY